MASKLSRFGVCKLGYLVIQTDLPILDNKEKDCESPLLFLLLSRFGFGKKPVLASKLSRFGVCQSGYLVIQTDLPNLDNKENGLLNSTVVFTLIQVWVQEKTSFGK